MDPRIGIVGLQYFAPNFRCATYGDCCVVEIPDGWERRYRWDGDAGTKAAIDELIASHGRRSRVFEGKAVAPPLTNGWDVPVEEWDRVMTAPVGYAWDKAKISDDEAMSLISRRKETMINVEVSIGGGGWTHYSSHASLREAIEQADLVHGRVACGDARVAAGDGEDHDIGILDSIRPDGMAVVRWDSGVVTEADPDDLELLCCLLMSEFPGVTVWRREPRSWELEAPRIAVVDVGRRDQPALSNFDHHQMPRDGLPCCALSLVLRALGQYDDAFDVYPWLEATEIADSKGPSALAAHAGMPAENLAKMRSPVEAAILRMFAESTDVVPASPLHELMRTIGESVLGYVQSVAERLKKLEEVFTSIYVEGIHVLDARLAATGNDDPVLGLEIFCKRMVNQPVVTITNDDRGDGYCLFRREDDPRIDFSRVEKSDDVVFAHKNGFVCKTRPGANTLVLISDAIVRSSYE